jgi:hypothetical protein
MMIYDKFDCYLLKLLIVGEMATSRPEYPAGQQFSFCGPPLRACCGPVAGLFGYKIEHISA